MNPFRLDLRALALLRIGLGLLMLADLAIRWPDIATFLTSTGACPVDATVRTHWLAAPLELYRHLDQAWMVQLAFVLHALCAMALVAGFYSRTACALCWYLFTSLDNRNPFVTDGGDMLLKLMLNCCLFLPIGARWALDARRASARAWATLPNSFLSIASVALVVQVCVMYWTAGILKNSPEWRQSGDALFLAFSIDQFSTGFARSLLSYPALLRALTFISLAVELTSPFLLLCPLGGIWPRCLALLLLAGFHLGISSTLHLGLFQPVCLVTLLALLPTPALDRLLPQTARPVCPGAADSPEPQAERNRSPAVPLSPILPSGYRLRRPTRLLVASYIAFIVLQNALTIPEIGSPGSGNFVQLVLNYGRATATMQNWTLFAPVPLRQDGWFVVEGITVDGRQIDLLSGKPSSYAKPASVADTFPNQRWRRHFQNLWLRYNPRHVPLYLRYCGRNWNRTHTGDDRLQLTRLIFVQEYTQLPGVPPHPEVFSLGEFPSTWLPGSWEDGAE